MYVCIMENSTLKIRSGLMAVTKTVYVKMLRLDTMNVQTGKLSPLTTISFDLISYKLSQKLNHSFLDPLLMCYLQC